MKKITNIILLIVITIFATACSPKSESIDIINTNFSNYHCSTSLISKQNIKLVDTKIYYAENRYVTFSIEPELSVNYNDNDIVLFEDGTAMVKLYSTINIYPTNSDFKLIYNNFYVNLKTSEIINKISTGNKTYNLSNIDLENLKIVNATMLSAKYEKFEPIGACVYIFDSETEADNELEEKQIDNKNININVKNNIITSNTGTIYYAYFKDDLGSNNYTPENIDSNIEYNLEVINTQSDKINVKFNFDLLYKPEIYIVYTILKDSSGNFYFMEMTLNETSTYESETFESSKINTILLKVNEINL